MLVKDCKNFNFEFPEIFSWGQIDSAKLSYLANIICCHIKSDLKTHNRNLIPGLRQTLCYIAELAEI